VSPKGEVIGVASLAQDITERKMAEDKLQQAHQRLVETSRLAGMAEVASSVLHNVGNVLNSVNISSAVMSDSVRNSKVVNLGKVAAMIREHRSDLATFLTSDPKGKQLPDYLNQLAEHLGTEQEAILSELESLNKNIEHIKDIVTTQQSYARASSVEEQLEVADLVEDALRMNAGALTRHDVQVVREYAQVPPLRADKHKVLQILVNLIRNAKYALDEGGRSNKRLTVRVKMNGQDRLQIEVSDDGIGIAPEIMPRIFEHGFTTRKEGHGFGLHSSILTAKEMEGLLSVRSDGLGKGAAFTLELPLNGINGSSHKHEETGLK
jgi:C4-dicarboxylate-specific signal transduction histidine kinase